ncbi:MAG TPA: DegT/DnrJ/EryC1/StrS family aminotransferase [Longimicrobium sp.]|jgi:perosamine synthetase
MMNSPLALHGGAPVRPTYKPARPRVPAEARDEVLRVLDDGTLARFYGGTHVRALEAEFAAWFGRSHGVAVNSGTSALHVAYVAAGLPPFSEVLVPANAYISAITALIQSHLVPVIVDVDPSSWVMDPVDARRKLTSRTSAIVPVHMYGQPCPMDDLLELARAHGLWVLEDCGQAHGGMWNGRLLGSLGDAAAYSVCCRKHVTSGEGGLVISDSAALVERARSLAHKGKGDGWFEYLEMGFSYNMTEVQAVLARHGLRALEHETQTRQKFAAGIRAALDGLGLEFPHLGEGSAHAYFKFNFLLPRELGPWRNEIVTALRRENVGADPAHPYVLEIDWLRNQEPLLYSQITEGRPCYARESCPTALDVMARQVGLELGPGLDQEDIEYTIAAVRKVIPWYAQNHARLGSPTVVSI